MAGVPKALLALGLLMLPFSAFASAEGDLPLEKLSWLAGDWRIDRNGRFVQEVWLAPVNDSMSAVFRMFQGDRLIVHEYFLVAREGDDVVLRFKHFRADYSTWEQDGPLTFRLTSLEDCHALFENVDPQPSAPDLLEYSRAGAVLTAVVKDKPGPETGDPMIFELELHGDEGPVSSPQTSFSSCATTSTSSPATETES